MSESNENDIAIVGMALRVPGANSPLEFWRNLHDGVESIREIGEEELLESGETLDSLRDRSYVPFAGTIDGLKLFDREFFGFSPKEAAILDPQHRHFLECCWEALEDAGHTPDHFDGQIGVFGGCGMGSYFYFNVCSNKDLVDSVGLFLLRHTGNDKDFLATRVSYTLDLRGPSVNVQTACSTSLVATHLACQSLLSGESDMALAGGVTIILPHSRGYHFKEGEILSPDGHCHAFDHRAKGTVLASGAGVVALRRLDDALEAGDPIYGIIKGSAVNNDGGQKVGYLAPSVDGQAAAMTEAYAVADIDPKSIGYVECHGTGTYMGDPIEVEALTQAFRQSTEENGFCRIGSVKTNIGHLDTAAGVLGLIKATLSLYYKKIPASLNYEQPNPVIEFGKTPFVVNDGLYDWTDQGAPRRAAVNSLGVGGTNAHVILEEFSGRVESDSSQRRRHLFVLSAKNQKSLEGNCDRLAAALREQPNLALADIAHTLARSRSTMGRRCVMVAETHEEAIDLLESRDPRRVFVHQASESAVSVVFMFSGGATQYAGMSRGLYAEEPVFRKYLDHGLNLLEERMGVDFRRLICCEVDALAEAEEHLAPMHRQLPAIFIVEYAMAQLWKSWGIEPDALIGHSMGENAAACLAGVLSFEDCLDWMIKRGELMERTPSGAMLSVRLTEDEISSYLGEECDLAAVNAPGFCVASGPIAAIESLAKRLDEAEVDVARLAIPRAAHSRLFDSILDEFRDFVCGLDLKPPRIPMISNRTGRVLTDQEAVDPDYWVEHLRSTVRFSDGVATLLETPDRLMIEVGPGQALCSFARQQIDSSHRANLVPSMRHRDDHVSDAGYFLASIGRVWASGKSVDLSKLYENEKRALVRLPTYAWDHQPYFIEPKAPEVGREESTSVDRIEDISRWGSQPVWQAMPIMPVVDAEAVAPQTWLIFMDHVGVGSRLEKRLRARGERVLTVYAGDAFHARGNGVYTLAPELGRAGYSALLQDLIASGAVPNQIVHLWLVTGTERFRPGSSFFHQNMQDGFYSLYFLAKAIGEEGLATDVQLSVVSNHMQSVSPTDRVYPERATVLGPAQVIPRELSGVKCRSIDLELPASNSTLLSGLTEWIKSSSGVGTDMDTVIDLLEFELVSPPGNELVAHRDGQRLERRFAPVRLAPRKNAGDTGLVEGGTYLITGGLGGLGLALADRLAREIRPRLVLLGRSPLPEPSEWDGWLEREGVGDLTSQRIRKVRLLQEAGADVRVVAADVTNLDQMREVLTPIKDELGAIHGIFHTAGVLNDELIQLKRDADIEEVFGPKVHGTLVLDSLLDELGTELFVLYSSTSAIVAPHGQVDYVGANAFLDAYAASRSTQSTRRGQAGSGVPARRTVAVNWGIWNEIGLAASGFAADEEEESTDVVLAVDYPLFDTRQKDSHGRTVFDKSYSPQRDWVLNEHRARSGEALLPGTSYPELARAALAEYGEHGPFDLREVYFVRPVHVADGEVENVRVLLHPSERGYRFEVRTRCRIDGRVGWALNVEAQIELGHVVTAEPLSVDDIDRRCQVSRSTINPNGHRSGQENHVMFGPRWRVLRQVLYGQGEALARLEVPEAFLGDLKDFGLHPALLDYATGYAMELIPGYDPNGALWIPVSYGRISVFCDLPAEIVSWVRILPQTVDDSDFAVFDVTLSDSSGQVLVDIEGFTIKRLSAELKFSADERPAVSTVEFESSMGQSGAGDASPAEKLLRRNYERGIQAEEGTEALLRVLADDSRSHVVVSSLDLEGLARQTDRLTDQVTPSGARFERPELGSDYVAARDDIERTLVGIWEELLGVENLGVTDNFFELGGHSLIAVRLFARIKKAYRADFPISVLFEAPTIEGCAALIREVTGDLVVAVSGGSTDNSVEKRRTRHKHLVAMDAGGHEGGAKSPFFLVAGMFGNVLNLRHLAALVGADRPFYGLQARGLYGDESPHETFDVMAKDYIAEIRSVQPHGPYFIAGFSGGGITAFEMAHQLLDAGEEVGILVLLDTPLPVRPPLTKVDRVRVQLQRVRQQGIGYLVDWAMNRGRWQLEQLRLRLSGDKMPERKEDQFHNEAIERAFREALPRYQLKHYPGRVNLFRPALDRAYVLGPDRVLDSAKEWVYPDNGYTEWIDSLAVYEMPGDHDSMVLEPNVRVMAATLKNLLAEAEVNLGLAKEPDVDQAGPC